MKSLRLASEAEEWQGVGAQLAASEPKAQGDSGKLDAEEQLS